MSNYVFADPWILILLAAVPLLWWNYRRTYARRYPNLRLPSLQGLDAAAGWRARLRGWLPYLRLLALALLIIALARPQKLLQEEEIRAEGIDIVLAIDLSSSMLARFVIWEDEDVLQVPTGALFRTGNGWGVFTAENGTAVMKEVTLGHRAGLATQVISGLSEGDIVITHPDNAVADGARIRSD